MQFTPQQLAGAQRYGSNTRIGNWLEDCKLKETKIAEFCEAKEYVHRRAARSHHVFPSHPHATVTINDTPKPPLRITHRVYC